MENVFVVMSLKPLNDQYECEFDKQVEFVGTSEGRAKDFIRNDILVRAHGVKHGFDYRHYHVYALRQYQIVEVKSNDNHSTNIISQYTAFVTKTDIIIEEDFLYSLSWFFLV